MVREARKLGLRAPVMLMGYYNPLLQYGEDRLLADCKSAGVNGFIVVDLPPEEAVSFRKLCSKGRYVASRYAYTLHTLHTLLPIANTPW